MAKRKNRLNKLEFILSVLAKYEHTEDEEDMQGLQDQTDYSFTEIQRKINKFFFSDDENIDEVFGVEVDDDEEEE